jgi:hypothetical protein
MRTLVSPAPAPGIEDGLMAIPFGQWIPAPEASRRLQELGLPREALTSVVRKGRRTGVLRTRRDLEVTYVMRVRGEGYRCPT